MLGMRRLVCVSLCDDAIVDALEDHFRDWELCRVHDLGKAACLLRRADFLVGLIVVSDVGRARVDDIANLLSAHADVQWIGILPPRVAESAAWRDLIVGSLVDFHTLPVDFAHLAQIVGHTYGMARLREQDRVEASTAKDATLVGGSPAMVECLRQIRKIARVEAPVLIRGPSGSGKELAAQAVHRYSARNARPFVPVNCGAIPASLIQSELFGYERGAFTGAAQAKRGLFESAAGGTLFLDEIADLSFELQTNLLRFLQEKTISRVGSTQSMPIDVRIVAATHVDLEEAIRAGKFREDLYYRLNVLALSMPPLCKRKEDISTLARHFFRQFASEKNLRLSGFSQRALNAMEAHSWPGNVRELINRVRRAMVMAEGRLITVDDIGLECNVERHFAEGLGEARVTAERHAIVSGLHRARKNVSQTARDLGVSRMTLYRLMAKHQIDV